MKWKVDAGVDSEYDGLDFVIMHLFGGLLTLLGVTSSLCFLSKFDKLIGSTSGTWVKSLLWSLIKVNRCLLTTSLGKLM